MDGDRKIVLVTRQTPLQELVLRYNTVEQARFHVEHLGMDFADFLAEDTVYRTQVAQVSALLQRHGRLQPLDRGFLPNFLFPPDALVVVLGQDGLVANVLKYLDSQPVLALNPDPARWDGVLLPFAAGDLASLLPEVLRGRRPLREITMARATLSDGQTLRAVNDLIIGARTHASARYELAMDGHRERQSSSGIIVSTGLGSTGWLRSVLTGAMAITGGQPGSTPQQLLQHGLAWDAPQLVFSVREPFPGRSSHATIVFGQVGQGGSLDVRSLMPDDGVIFSDGMQADALAFSAGLTARIGIDAQRAHLLH